MQCSLAEMKDVLLYHIVPGKLGRDNFRPGAEYTTLLPYPAVDGANGRNETVRSVNSRVVGWVHVGSSPAALFCAPGFLPGTWHSPVPEPPKYLSLPVPSGVRQYVGPQ